jgi:hypothetical protein
MLMVIILEKMTVLTACRARTFIVTYCYSVIFPFEGGINHNCLVENENVHVLLKKMKFLPNDQNCFQDLRSTHYMYMTCNGLISEILLIQKFCIICIVFKWDWLREGVSVVMWNEIQSSNKPQGPYPPPHFSLYCISLLVQSVLLDLASALRLRRNEKWDSGCGCSVGGKEADIL